MTNLLQERTPAGEAARVALLEPLLDGARIGLINLYGRWRDEYQYEDFADYAKALSALVLKHAPTGTQVLSASKRPFGVTIQVPGLPYTVALTINGKGYGWAPVDKVALVNPNETPKTKAPTIKSTSNQEDIMAKNKTKTVEVKKDNGPTYGLPYHRNSTPSIRWTMTDALMALEKPVAAESVAKKVASKMTSEFGYSADEVVASVREHARWLVKNKVKGFVGLEAIERKAPAPKAKKAIKPKVKVKKLKAASANGDILG